jgi:hypothetical protein
MSGATLARRLIYIIVAPSRLLRMNARMSLIDLAMLILTAAAFAGAIAYVWACDGLTGERGHPPETVP